MTEHISRLVYLVFTKYLPLLHHDTPVPSVSQHIPSFVHWFTKLMSVSLVAL